MPSARCGLDGRYLHVRMARILGDCTCEEDVGMAGQAAVVLENGDLKVEFNGRDLVVRATTADYSVVQDHLNDQAPAKP